MVVQMACPEPVGEEVCGAPLAPGDEVCPAHRAARTAVEVQEAEQAAQSLLEAAQRVEEWLSVQDEFDPFSIAGVSRGGQFYSLNVKDLRALVENAKRATEVD